MNGGLAQVEHSCPPSLSFKPRIVLARPHEEVSILSYLSVIYGWVVDGLSTLFDPITGQKHSGWPGLNVGGEIDSQRQDSNARPTKRNSQRSVTGLALAHCLEIVHVLSLVLVCSV